MRLIDEAALINEAETGNWDIDLKELKMILKYIPTIDAAPVMHGEWVTTRTIIHDGELYCSLCGQEALAEYGRHTYIKSNYCPNCGAKMEAHGKDINVPTNADRIRNMSDEELAVWLVGATVCERVCSEDEYCQGNECVERVTRWLKQPAKEEHNEID